MAHQRIRAAALLAGACAATEAVRLLALRPLTRLGTTLVAGADPTALPFEAVATTGCALALLACWAWWLLAGLVLVVDVLRHGAATVARPRWCPAVVRAVVLTALGVAAAAGPASADPVGAHGSAPAPARADGVVGLVLPDRVATPSLVRVRAGDSLWAIAERQLAATATDAAVTRAWRRLAAANADRIGDDPDLIFPGTLLRVPDLRTPPGKEPS